MHTAGATPMLDPDAFQVFVWSSALKAMAHDPILHCTFAGVHNDCVHHAAGRSRSLQYVDGVELGTAVSFAETLDAYGWSSTAVARNEINLSEQAFAGHGRNSIYVRTYDPESGQSVGRNY